MTWKTSTAKGWLLSAAALSAFLALAPIGSAQVEVDAQRVAFERELERVRKKMEQGDWKVARKRLESALGEHAEAPYVFAHLGEIELALKRCEFWKDRPEPDISGLLKGELRSSDRRTGRIELHYEKDRPHDFQRAGMATLLPIEFSGPYKIESSEGTSPTLLVCCRGQESIQVSFGRVFHLGINNPAHKKPTQRWVKIISNLRGRDGKIERKLKEKDFTSKRGLDKEIFEVRVTGNQVRAYFNGKSLLSAAKPRDLWGSIAVTAGGPYNTLDIEGVATGWLQRKVDESFRDEWTEFERSWVLADHVPAWLAEKVREDPTPLDTATETHGLPAEASKGDVRKWNRAVAQIDRGRYDLALRAMDELTEKGLECGQVIRLRAVALRGLRRSAEALELLFRCVERYPDLHQARHDLARTLLVNGRFEEALTVVADAIEAGAPPMGLQPISITANKALHGPAWSGKSVYSSRHYTVSSDLSEAICRTVALELEETFRHVSRRLGFGEHVEGKKFQVYVFSGEASYLDYIEDVFEGRGDNTLGMYSFYLKQLLVLDSPRRADFMHTVRHEGFHQFLDAQLETPPIWLNEGLAEYFAAARTDTSWRDGKLERRRLEVLRTPRPGRSKLEQRLTPLSAFLHLESGAFMRNASYNYAQAWAFVHFLRHTSRENRTRFDSLIESLRAGVANRKAIESAFEGCDLDELDVEFREYVEGL